MRPSFFETCHQPAGKSLENVLPSGMGGQRQKSSFALDRIPPVFSGPYVGKIAPAVQLSPFPALFAGNTLQSRFRSGFTGPGEMRRSSFLHLQNERFIQFSARVTITRVLCRDSNRPIGRNNSPRGQGLAAIPSFCWPLRRFFRAFLAAPKWCQHSR